MRNKKFSYLRKKRQELGLTCKELSKKLNMHQSSISMIENRKIVCAEVRARRFANFFDEIEWTKFLVEKKNEE